MVPRTAPRRDQDNVDYSAIGKLGRRTGVTLDRRPLDANGMEEITGIFSSPRKPSPLKNMTVMESVEATSASPASVEMSGIDSSGLTPTQALSSRRPARGSSNRLPRSSSPRKSGISGTARKSNGVDIFSPRKSMQPEDPEDRENTPVPTPSRIVQTRRFSPSPEKSPLREIIANGAFVSGKPRPSIELQPNPSEIAASVTDDDSDPYAEAVQDMESAVQDTGYYVTPIEDSEEAVSIHHERDESEELGSPRRDLVDEEADYTSKPDQSLPLMTQNTANSRRKRKSDAADLDEEAVLSEQKKRKGGRPPELQTSVRSVPSSSRVQSSKAKGKQPLRNKDTNLMMSSRQERELNDLVEKVKARPDPPRSLYILRRETPADDGIARTRSGRISVKPLAYWRNERCIYGGSPGSASLEDGARFPLNSIKEIVRTEQMDPAFERKKPVKKQKSGKGIAKARRTSVEEEESSDSDFDMDAPPKEDPQAEPWESKTGTLRCNVSVWNNQEQAPTEQEMEVEIAHAPAAITTREVKGSSLDEGPTFRFAKLLSTKFFGTGLVDLPPGGIKRPKNSRKMHMSFFVVTGRVAVSVGPLGGEMTRFSIGKGGFWQVPRGNQYSIKNEGAKAARIFFSQGCEPAPAEDEE